VPKKARLFRALHLRRGVDGYVVYASAQQRFLVEELGVSAAQVFLRPFMVDSTYFRPAPADAPGRRTISTAGLELRDYPTLMRAVTGLDADVVVAAASPWSKRANELEAVPVPDNVTVAKFTLAELRELYARSTMVVMPLYPSDFQAGITTILEAMSMGRAIVCTRTDGQTDTIADGITGLYVPAGDPEALRTAIERVLGDEELRRRLGDAARAWVIDHAELDRYVEQLVDVVAAYRPVRR
jgi:glycosyltransferase involved in cell wall biosynthesis